MSLLPRGRKWRWWLAAAAIPAASSVTAADEPLCVIAGGSDGTGHVYSWTVTNRGLISITAMEFPSSRGALFTAPPGWITELNSAGPGGKGCLARARTANDGIPPGRSATFTIQTNPTRAKRGIGAVRVRFADGSDLAVPGVELPLPEPMGDKYVPLVGLAAIFGVWMILHALRRRRPARSRPEQGSAAAT